MRWIDVDRDPIVDLLSADMLVVAPAGTEPRAAGRWRSRPGQALPRRPAHSQ
jgi:hypothetical protein